MSTRLAVLKNENFLTMLQTMGRSWLPADPDLIERLQFEIAEGRYDTDADALIAELKKDISLFSYCIRSLSAMLPNEDDSPDYVHPVALLREAGVERLKRILAESHEDLHLHRFHHLKSYQINRMKESVASARAAETLAESAEIDGDIGYASALLRQLGLTLIAWNYPRLYTRALAELDEGKTVDQVLDRVLGFSPLLLGISLARQWKLLPEVRIALGDVKGLTAEYCEEAEEAQRVGKSLHKICEVSEALARSQSGERYPGARADWLTAKSEIERRLGKQGFKLLEERIKESCTHYTRALPKVLQVNEASPLERATRVETSAELFKRNTYIAFCPPKVRTELEELYRRIQPDCIDKNTVRALASKIIPDAGFLRGCVYAYEPVEHCLVPRLAIGSAQLNEYESISCDAMQDTSQPLRTAFLEASSLYVTQTWDVRSPALVVAAYGDVQKVGVISLEVSQELSRLSEEQCVTMLKAFKQALMDALKLQ